MDDIEEELLRGMREPIPLAAICESSSVTMAQVSCSKIIQSRTSTEIRFRSCERIRKILEFNGIDVYKTPYPRPERSPFPCFNCHRRFQTPPIFMPMRTLGCDFEEDLNFCSGACMNTYLYYNMNDVNYPGRCADALEYMRQVHGFAGSELGFAPHFSQHVLYGGDLDDAQFDAIIGTPELTTKISRAPFIPTESVVEWQCRQPEGSAAGAAKPADALTPAAQMLREVMQSDPMPAAHHQRWASTSLRQPSLAAIEERLASLPVLPKKPGAYEIWLAETGGIDADAGSDSSSAAADAAAAEPPAVTKSTKKQAAKKPPPPETGALANFVAPSKAPRRSGGGGARKSTAKL